LVPILVIRSSGIERAPLDGASGFRRLTVSVSLGG
jgi:hypothetical protein